MEQQLTRLLPWQFADRHGTYVLEADPERHWRDCRVIDLSSSGAVIELVDAPAEPIKGHDIFFAVHLRAEIRNFTPTDDHRKRVWTQFVHHTHAAPTYRASVGGSTLAGRSQVNTASA